MNMTLNIIQSQNNPYCFEIHGPGDMMLLCKYDPKKYGTVYYYQNHPVTKFLLEEIENQIKIIAKIKQQQN